MADTPSWSRDERARRPRRVGAGWLSVLEVVVLGPLAAYVVLLAIPSVFEIESQCVGPYGVQRIAGDSYFAGAGVGGTLGWLAVIGGAIYAQIADSPRLVVLLPIAWFLAFVSGSFIVAAALGAQLCPD
jgi:hypothetical protein